MMPCLSAAGRRSVTQVELLSKAITPTESFGSSNSTAALAASTPEVHPSVT
jgi:hypothetical protein